MKVKVEGVNTLSLHAIAERGHGLGPQAVKTGDSLSILIYPVVEPDEYIGAVRGHPVSHLPLTSNEWLHLAHKRRLAGSEFGGFEIDASLLEVATEPITYAEIVAPDKRSSQGTQQVVAT
jgi:hypothetical protein